MSDETELENRLGEIIEDDEPGESARFFRSLCGDAYAELKRLREINRRFKQSAICLIRWAERSLRGDTDVGPYEPVKAAREALAFAEKAVLE